MPTEQAAATGAPSHLGIMGIQGRNGSDSTLTIMDGQCLEAMNIDWYRSSLARKRGGATTLALTTAATAFASGARALGRHVPAADQTAAEFWALDGAFNFHRLAGGVSWLSPTVLDACTASAHEANFVSFNSKLYVSYKSAHNRLHLWDGTSLRRVGLDLPAQIVTIVVAGGAVTDTRKYRIAWTKQVAGVTVQRSNLSVASASQALAAQQATITRTAAPGEGETHWELYAASTPNFSDYRLQATTVIATTTAVDNAALGTTVAPADGANTPPPSAKYMVADDARIIMGGCHETSANPENAITPKDNRVWWTSILGASDVGDDERVSVTGTINNYADLEEAISGISQPMQVVSAAANSLERGSFYVFSFDSQWKFVATGISTSPYLKFRITGGGGTVHHKSIVTAIDANGNPGIYWWSKNGPMRIVVDGQQFLGEDITDIVDTVNLDATIPCHSVYHADKRQVWFYVATSGSLFPNLRVIFDTRFGRVTQVSGVRFGWSVANGESAKAYCSCLFSDTVAASMGRKLKPYIGYTEATQIWKCDTTDTTDNGTAFQAYLDSRTHAPWGLNRKGGILDNVMVIADPAPGVTIQLLVYRNEGAETLPSTANLTDFSDSADADKVFALFEDSKLGDSFTIRVRVGDAQPVDSTWNLHALVIPVVYQGDH
jgi:hypothetical protein